MSSYPKSVGDHHIDEEWVCTACGATFDCLSQFRQNECV